MKNAFAIGSITGALALMVAVPLAAQYASAQSSSPAPSTGSQISSQASDAPDRADEHKGGHVGRNGQREELLTGDTAARVTQAALAAVPGGTIDRVESDADGAVYEAHMKNADGDRVTVLFDANFAVTQIDSK